MLKEVGYRYKEVLNESQESESIKAAKRLYMQRRGVDEVEADRWVRMDLRNDIPALRSKQGGKFILGVTRMFLDGEIRNANIINGINTSIQYASSEAHIKEYDRNLNGLSAQDFINKFTDAIKSDAESDRNARYSEHYTGDSNYKIIPIDTFEEAQTYSKYNEWCITRYENMFNSYTSDGISQFYFCLRNGFENVRCVKGPNCPLDEYGLSMFAVCVDMNGQLKTCTCRWNHNNGGNDHIMDTKQISQVINMNFYEVFKPNNKWVSKLAEIKKLVKAGKDPHSLFDFVSAEEEGFKKVKLGNHYNFINCQTYEFVSEQWFDIATDFSQGIAAVEIENKWNFINHNGQYISKEWFPTIMWRGKEVKETWIPVQREDALWYYINNNGDFLSEQGWDDVDTFYDGWSRVQWKKQFNYINSNNQLLSDEWFIEANPFLYGFACVKTMNGGWNLISTNGQKLLPDNWADDVKNFNRRGRASVRRDGKWGIIDRNGKIIVEPQFNHIDGWNHSDVARVEIDNMTNYVDVSNGELLLDRWAVQGRLPRETKDGIYAEVYWENNDVYPEDICLKKYGNESFLTRLRKRLKNEGKTIIISEKQAQLLKEHILNEGISNIVYHFTSIDNLYGIVINDKFYLKSGIFGSGSDLGGGKRMFYLSTTRNRNAKEGYSFMGKTSVRITLDGEKLAQKYHGQPFNYWGDGALGRMKYLNPEKVGMSKRWGLGVSRHAEDETEDRIWSYKATIENALSYIKRVDICIFNENEIIELDTRITNMESQGKTELVDALKRKKESLLQENEEMKHKVYDLKRTLKNRLFIYDNDEAFAFGSDGYVNPEWLNDWSNDAGIKDRIANASQQSNFRTQATTKRALAAALTIMVWKILPKNRKNAIVAFCKQYGFENLIDKDIFKMVDDYMWRYSNDISYIASEINPSHSHNRDDIAKVQNMFTHWMRKNGYSSLKDINLLEGKEIKKVRQGMIAYEEYEPDYEIGFEEGDISPYAHVITESPDYIERIGINYENQEAHPFIIFKGFENEPIVGLVGGETHTDIMGMLYDDVFYNDGNECYFDISNGLRNAIKSKEIKPLFSNSYYMQGRYFEESNEIKLGGNIISFYDYTIEGIKRNYSIIINLLNKIKEQGIPVNINTVDFDHWREDIAMRFPLKWIGNGVIDTILPIAYRIEKRLNVETPLYTIYAKNGKVLIVDDNFNIVHSEPSYVNEETKPEDVDLSSFEIKKKLNPKFWKNNKLDSRVRLKLLDIADDFVDSLNINWVEPSDITMTGSLANYTWDEKYSDIDLHIILKYKDVDERTDFVKNYFDAKKKEWNDKHKDIKIFGFPVEVYVQDENETHKSSGVYSIEKDEWVKEPDIENFSNDDYDSEKVKKIVANYMNRIDDIETVYNETDDDFKVEKVFDDAEETFNDIKDERKNAFKKTNKELSDGNVVFKMLRRNGYIEKISNLKDKSYNKLNSLD